MRSHFLLGQSPEGFHKIHYVEWGTPSDKPSIICVHGLTRNAHDFDEVGAALAEKDGRHVIAVDVIGRGASAWLKNPTLYNYPQYLSDMTAVIARAGNTPIDWIGTSMGGLIGMVIAALPKNPIRKMVLNDVGPFLPLAGMQRIGAYISQTPVFQTLEKLEDHLRTTYTSFKALTKTQWQKLAAHSARMTPDKQFMLAYDPAIATNFLAVTQDVDLWSYYDQMMCETLVLRGAFSDILSADVAKSMTMRGPKARLVEFPDIGHVPSLMQDDHIDLIRDFLRD
jgi:pimeloyl-ACP methyl ester carboxylesterase